MHLLFPSTTTHKREEDYTHALNYRVLKSLRRRPYSVQNIRKADKPFASLPEKPQRNSHIIFFCCNGFLCSDFCGGNSQSKVFCSTCLSKLSLLEPKPHPLFFPNVKIKIKFECPFLLSYSKGKLSLH